jgi:hypothetical protein
MVPAYEHCSCNWFYITRSTCARCWHFLVKPPMPDPCYPVGLLHPRSRALNQAMLKHAGWVPAALLQRPRFTWLVLGHRVAGDTGAQLHDPHPFPPGTPLSSASLLLAQEGSSTSSNLVINIHTAGWISGCTHEGSAGLVGRPHPTAPDHMQLAVVKGLGPEGNLTVLLVRFLADQVDSGCVGLWLKWLPFYIKQQRDRMMKGFRCASPTVGGAAATSPVQQHGQQPQQLFNAMLPPLEQQQQQQAPGGDAAPAEPPADEKVHRCPLGALGGTGPAAMLAKCAFLERLVEGAREYGVMGLLEQLETAPEVLLEAAREQQAQCSQEAPPPHAAGLLRLQAEHPLTPANAGCGELAPVQRLRASLEGLQQEGRESRMQQKPVEGQEPRPVFPRVLRHAVHDLLCHVGAVERAAAASAEAAPSAAAQAAAAAANGAPAAAAGGQLQAQQQQQQQEGDGRSVWVFGGLAAPVSPAVAQKLRSREAIAAAMRQPPEALDPRYRWLQHVLCAYLVSACCTAPCPQGLVPVVDIPFVR